MGAVLDKEGVVLKQDLQAYLSDNEANMLYELKAPVGDPYIRSSVANSRYEAKGVAQPKAPPNDKYLLSTMAYDNFQPKELPSDPYLTKNIADGKYLTQTTAEEKYQPKGEYAPKGDYLTLTTANGVYQPKGDYLTLTTANNTYAPNLDYLTKPAADNIYAPKDNYLTETTANNKFAPFGAYLTQEVADSKYAPVGPYLTKPTADTSYQPKGNYAPVGDYLTKPTADGIYQSKDPNGNLTANNIWNRSADFMLGINDGRGNFSNGMPGGRALVKGDNAQLVINFDGDFGGGTRIDGAKGLNLVQGPIIANTPGTQSVIQNLNISNGFNAPNANARVYGVIVGDAGVNSSGDILFKNGKSIIIPDGIGGYGAGNGSYIYNKGQTLNIEMRNGGDGKIQLKAGSKTASFDMNGNFCIGTTCMTETQLATMKSKTGIV